MKKGDFRISAKFAGNIRVGVSCLMKFKDLKPSSVLKKRNSETSDFI